MDANPWFVVHPPVGRARVRMVCFAYAGGGASAFRRWAALMPDGVELVAAQPPGREARFVETPLRALAPMVEGLRDAIVPLLDRPLVFFGHSLGALVAFELARALREAGLRQPAHLFVSGRRAPDIALGRRTFHDLPKDDLIEELRGMNGTASGVLEHPELMDMMLPVLRADFEVHDTYRYREGAPLDMPVCVFGGLDDIATDAANLAAWQGMTTRPSRVRMFRGGHFFIEQSRDDVLEAVRAEIAPLLAATLPREGAIA